MPLPKPESKKLIGYWEPNTTRWVDVINSSFGYTTLDGASNPRRPTRWQNRAIELGRAVAAGMVVVVSAGNGAAIGALGAPPMLLRYWLSAP
jgi:hypothetical protein